MGLEWEDRDARDLLAQLAGEAAAERLAASFTSLTDMSRASFGNTLRGIQDWAILPSLDRERLSQQEGIANSFCL